MNITSNKNWLLLPLFLAALSLNAQENISSKETLFKRYLNSVLKEKSDPSAPKLINYPTLAYSPETNWEFGVSSLYVYSAKRNLKNRLSEIKAFTFFTLENQYGLWLDHAVYTNKNKWFLYGRARYQSFPLLYLSLIHI